MRLFAIVITYYPDIYTLKNNIESFLKFVDKLVIWDNSKDSVNTSIKDLGLLNNKKVELFCADKNYLIAYPLNKMFTLAKEQGFSHVLTMDQDSYFRQNSFSCFKSQVETIELKDPLAAIFGSNPNDLVSDSAKEPFPVSDVITSGTIYNVNKMKTIGGFREDFGIDGVDIEVCYRAASRGYKVYISPQIRLLHRYGDPSKTRWGFTTQNYSPFRCYHITKNFIAIWIEYPKFFKQQSFFIKSFIFKGIPKILLGEQQKWKKLQAIILGAYDGLRRTKSRYL